MNEEDRRLQADERAAEPERFVSIDSHNMKRAQPAVQERHEELSPAITISSASSAARSSGESIQRQQIGVSRISTQHEASFDLERHPTALPRIQTGRSQHTQTIGASIRSRTITRHSKRPLPDFGAGKPYPPALPEREEYVVEFTGADDLLHAQNWPLKKKFPVAAVLGYVTLTAAFGSSVFSAALGSIAEVFNISREVAILGVSLYVLGFATGPLLWACITWSTDIHKPRLIVNLGANERAVRSQESALNLVVRVQHLQRCCGCSERRANGVHMSLFRR